MKKERHNFLIEAGAADRLKAIKARSGLSESEQVRRAIALWLQSFEWPIRPRKPRTSGRGGRQPKSTRPDLKRSPEI
jgi:hypothetical protein